MENTPERKSLISANIVAITIGGSFFLGGIESSISNASATNDADSNHQHANQLQNDMATSNIIRDKLFQSRPDDAGAIRITSDVISAKQNELVQVNSYNPQVHDGRDFLIGWSATCATILGVITVARLFKRHHSEKVIRSNQQSSTLTPVRT